MEGEVKMLREKGNIVCCSRRGYVYKQSNKTMSLLLGGNRARGRNIQGLW